LFGGCARCDLPSDWIDASTLRDVPDNQEVFVDRLGQTSVIIEILEYQGHVGDGEAAEFFFRDLADADHAISVEISSKSLQPVQRKFLMDPLGSSVLYIKGTQAKAKSGREPTSVCDYMTVIRVPGVMADILVTTHSESSDVETVHTRISESLEFTDPHIFS